MKIDYSKFMHNPAVTEDLTRRINKMLAIEEDKTGKPLNYNDIAAAFGSIMCELWGHVPQDQRGDVYERFVNALRVQGEIPLTQMNGTPVKPN